MKQVKAISGNKKNRVYHLSSTVANSDPIRAARLAGSKKKTDIDALEKLNNGKMVYGDQE